MIVKRRWRQRQWQRAMPRRWRQRRRAFARNCFISPIELNRNWWHWRICLWRAQLQRERASEREWESTTKALQNNDIVHWLWRSNMCWMQWQSKRGNQPSIDMLCVCSLSYNTEFTLYHVICIDSLRYNTILYYRTTAVMQQQQQKNTKKGNQCKALCVFRQRKCAPSFANRELIYMFCVLSVCRCATVPCSMPSPCLGHYNAGLFCWCSAAQSCCVLYTTKRPPRWGEHTDGTQTLTHRATETVAVPPMRL